MSFPRRTLIALVTATAIGTALPALAQNQTIKIANVVELSGAGATAGTMFKSGI